MGGYLRYGATDRNWRTEAGQIESNSTVAIGLGKIAQKVAQAKLTVKTINPDGSYYYKPDPRLFSFTAPMPGLDEATILKAIACPLKVYGNAYLLKRRSKTGFLIGLAPLMPWQVVPKSDIHVDGSPTFPLLVPFTLAVGISAAAAIFSPLRLCVNPLLRES